MSDIQHRRLRIFRPWRIDEDNERRIVIKDDRGDTVHHTEFGAMPRALHSQERINCHAMVEAVNELR